MEELLKGIQEIVRSEIRNELGDFKNEMTEFKNEMTEFKNEMTEFKLEMTEFKLEMTKEMKNVKSILHTHDEKFDIIEKTLLKHENEFKDIKNTLNSHTEELKSLNSDVKFIKQTLIQLEFEHGQKIDAIYDLVNLDKEINKPKFDEINKISQKSDRNSLCILNHEKRISNLEDFNS